MSVLPPKVRLFKKHLFRIAAIVVAIFILLAAWIVYDRFFRTIPQTYIPGSQEAFKYGSIGVEDESGIPYLIWLVLPRVFPEHLPGPGGYASLGLVWESGHDMPVGFSKKRIGYERVAFNCALCHTSTYRQEENGRPGKTVIVPGGAATRLDPQAYIGFLGRCANDPRFNPDTILEAIEYNVELSTLDRALYRHVLIPATRKAILEQSENSTWMLSRPPWGHGRIDPFNPVKFGMLEMKVDATVGNSDMMPVWELNLRQAKEEKWHLHWDGLSTNPNHCSLAGALGDGASRKSIPDDNIRALVKSFMGEGKFKFVAPKHPNAPQATDPDVLAGKLIFKQNCAICHEPVNSSEDRQLVNTVIPRELKETPNHADAFYRSWAGEPAIATDVNRIDMWNPVTLANPSDPDQQNHPATRYNAFANGYLDSFVGTSGYVAVPLNGIWLRSPYLHNGSVPTLRDLLNPPMTKNEINEAVELLNVKATGVGETIDYQELIASFSQISTSELPLEQASKRLHRLGTFVDSMIEIARTKGKRPPIFYRGSDVLTKSDENTPDLVGFKHNSSAVKHRRLPIPYITSVQGNGNNGHLWGTKLDKEEKMKLVKYLKTL